MFNRLSFLAMICVIVLLPAGAAAQTTGGTLSGTVTDESGAAVPGVTVTIRQIETDGKRVIVTDREGRYQAEALQPGTYQITVELVGFQTNVREGITLNLGQHAVVNFPLKLGGIEERITVTETVPLVDTTRGGVTALVEQEQIRELPLNGRDFQQLTLLQPGVIGVPSAGGSMDRGMGTQIAIAGARPNQISFLLDGADVNSQGNQAPGSAAGGRLGVETVREFQILVNSYSAEYGRSTGGIVSAVTRSGTNTFHGAGFEFHRNDSFDAKQYFDDPDAPNPPFTRNQFGGYAGGPIKRNRTFFFGSYEGLRQDRTQTTDVRVPSRATRARTDINPVIKPYLDLYPLPNGIETGQTGIYTHTLADLDREDYFIVKVDHSFSDNDSLSVRYLHSDSAQEDPSGLGYWETHRNTLSQFLVGEHKRIFSSKLLNVLRVAWNRPYEEEVSVMNIPDDPSLYFLPGTRIGSISVSELDGLGPDSGTPNWFDYKSLQVINTLTSTAGAHTLKAGVSWTKWFNDQDSSFQFGGTYNFTSIADFLQGRPNTYEGVVPGSTTARQWRQNLVGLFVQDDFTVSDRVTLNAGVRYEFITEPTEKQDRVAHMESVLDPKTTVGYPLFKNPSLKNFSPRVGFAWDVFGDGRTSVRGGGGLFYEPILGNMYRAYGNRTPPFIIQANIARPPFPRPEGTFIADTRLDLFDWEPENPYRLQYNVTVQREVLPQTVVTLGYIGSRGYHQIRNVEANHSIPEILSDGRLFFPQGPPGAVGRPPRRNPNFESIRLRTTDGRSWYNGMTAGVTKRFSRGLQLQGSYTLGRSMDHGAQSVGSGDGLGAQPAYAYDLDLEYGRSGFDIRHNFVFNYSWELPFGRGLGGVAGALVDGWQVSGIVSMRSGVPFNPSLAFDRARARPRSGGGGQRASWAPGYDRANVIIGNIGRGQQYFDPNAFVLPEAGFFGDVQRNALEGPGFATWDMGLFKNFRLRARYRAQFRLEAFNVLNRANFGLPASTVFNSAGRLSSAGEITRVVGTARQIQVGFKFEF